MINEKQQKYNPLHSNEPTPAMLAAATLPAPAPRQNIFTSKTQKTFELQTLHYNPNLGLNKDFNQNVNERKVNKTI